MGPSAMPAHKLLKCDGMDRPTSETRSITKAGFIGVLALAVMACSAELRNGDDLGGGGSGSGSGGGGNGAGGGEDFRTCQAVDLLFVVDNSPSMGPYQHALAQAFPAFVDAIYDKLPMGTDVHVGITTTSFYSGSCSEGTANCVSTASQSE